MGGCVSVCTSYYEYTFSCPNLMSCYYFVCSCSSRYLFLGCPRDFIFTYVRSLMKPTTVVRSRIACVTRYWYDIDRYTNKIVS